MRRVQLGEERDGRRVVRLDVRLEVVVRVGVVGEPLLDVLMNGVAT